MKTGVFAREVSQKKTAKRVKRERCRKMKVLETSTTFNGEQSDYFPRLVLKGRRSPVPSGGILLGVRALHGNQNSDLGGEKVLETSSGNARF